MRERHFRYRKVLLGILIHTYLKSGREKMKKFNVVVQ
jgi:hypothetical protein